MTASHKTVATAAVIAAGLLLTATTVQAGASGGPRRDRERVDAYSTNVYHITFRARELAQVSVIGDGDTDLDLYIYDEYGNLIDSDTDYTDVCLAQWYPRWTGVFRIEVRNLGGVYNVYDLKTN